MTKPHEEEWDIDDVSVHLRGPIVQQAARDKLAAAAPDMARALLEIRDAINSGTLSLDDLQSLVERPLRQAGVL